LDVVSHFLYATAECVRWPELGRLTSETPNGNLFARQFFGSHWPPDGCVLSALRKTDNADNYSLLNWLLFCILLICLPKFYFSIEYVIRPLIILYKPNEKHAE